ncbi:MAG: acetylglutamate kinase [Spirochaetaceae bacterium]|jgi:acetylglutamate kinase|nr:acetylglutamate kinase [Spirochaetaceae bacterium]
MKKNMKNKNHALRAEILIHALPYIKHFRGKTIVVKYGGSAMIKAELKNAVIEDLILMSYVGIRTVLVHGGGPEIEGMLNALGKESRFVQGLRYTDEATMEVVQMVLCGKVNKDITALIENSGGRAMGLCGIDGSLLKARQHKPGGEDIGLVGEVVSVNAEILENIFAAGTIPVVSSVALGTEADAGKVFNVNADIAAAKIAAALGAEKLILMTDVVGVLKDINDDNSLIKLLPRTELAALKNEGIISKGMIPKVDCCALAVDGGVKGAHIIDGRLPHALLIELFTNEGIGTMVLPSNVWAYG